MLGVGGLTLAVHLLASAPDAIWRPPPDQGPIVSPAVPLVPETLSTSAGSGRGLGPVLAGWLERLFAALPLEGIEPALAAVAVVPALGFAIARQLRIGVVPAAASVLALAFSGLFWSQAAGDGHDIYAVVFALGSLLGLLRWNAARRWGPLVTLSSCYGLAVGINPSVLAALPVLLVAGHLASRRPAARGASPTSHRDARSALLAPAIGLAAALGLAAWVAPSTFAEASASLPRTLDAAGKGAASGGFRTVGPMLAGEFGVLGLSFLVTGVVSLFGERPRALLLLGGWSLAVGLWVLIWPGTAAGSSLLLALAPLWLVAGAGMGWLSRAASGPVHTPAVTVLILMLPVMHLVGQYPSGARARGFASFIERYAEALDDTAAAGSVVLAEGGIRDRLVADQFVRVLPQDPELIGRLFEDDYPIIGFAGARANLRALGWRFTPIGRAGVPMTVAEYVSTVPRGWTVALAGGQRFAFSVPLGHGPTFQSIGGAVDLFGTQRPYYAIIGVRGRPGAAVEQTDRAPVDVQVAAGDDLGPVLRARVGLRAVSDERGGRIEYRGHLVARTVSGVAIAVISPTGILKAASGFEDSGDARIRVNPPGWSPGYVAGREPCAAVDADGWTDVTMPAARAAVGALLPGHGSMLLYLGSDHRLSPRPASLDHPHVAEISVRAFRAADAGAENDLRAALRRDGFDPDPGLTGRRHVHRIRATSPGAGRSQLGLRLGGFVDVAFARVTSAHSPAPLSLCGAMSGAGYPLFARSPVAPAPRDVDLRDRDLFLHGWHAPERDGAAMVRWTSAREAQVLLPLGQVGPVELEIEARPVTASGATIHVQVNGLRLPAFPLRPEHHVYRWRVPATAWRAGMNQVRVGTSQLVRPADVGSGHDTRTLGLAVKRIRLTLRE